MNVTSFVRRSEQPLQIGGRHGYRIDGDLATINAELSVPPYHPGGAWALELWACAEAWQGGELSGAKVSDVQFALPTPLAPHIHRVEAQVPARLPLQGRAHVMLLALVELGREGQNTYRRVHDVANYPELETFAAPRFEGEVGYEIRGREVVLQAAGVVNPRPAGNLSGTLSIELWALSADADAPSELAPGHCLASAQLAPVAGGEMAEGLHCRAAFAEPPPGRFQLVLKLREWTQALGYLTRDQRDFALPYQVAAEPSSARTDAPLAEAPPPQAGALSEEPASWDVELPEAASWEAAAPEAEALEVPEAAALEAAAPEAVTPEAAALEVPEAAPLEAARVPEVAVVAPEVVAPEVVAPEAAALEVPEAAPPEAAAPELPEAAAAEAPPSTVLVRASRAVSIQTASVDELARVKGLNTKIAKEIIKARPFASLDELLKVRGIGRKTFDRLRSLVTL